MSKREKKKKRGGGADDPKAFLVQFLEELDAGLGGTYDLFDESNIESMFGMLDPTTTGFITFEQYKEAISTLGITEFDPHPEGSENNKISVDTFMQQAKRGLIKSAATFKL
ncbi:hypothetical protein LSAT2_000428 [Lamellibrachia satsuma]|nr:hypothetical protein LSAT2_000428 [Lamellibrachia satsuma]